MCLLSGVSNILCLKFNCLAQISVEQPGINFLYSMNSLELFLFSLLWFWAVWLGISGNSYCTTDKRAYVLLLARVFSVTSNWEMQLYTTVVCWLHCIFQLICTVNAVSFLTVRLLDDRRCYQLFCRDVFSYWYVNWAEIFLQLHLLSVLVLWCEFDFNGFFR